MMDIKDLHQLDNEVNPNYEPSILKLLQILRPNWEYQKIGIKVLKDGSVNKTLLCSSFEAGGEESIIIRTNPCPDPMAGTQRQLEYATMCTLSKKNLCQKLIARFRNGLVYSYMEGKAIPGVAGYNVMCDPLLQRLVLDKLYPVHNVPLSDLHMGRLGIHDNFWYKVLHEKAKKICSKFDDKNIQDRFVRTFGSLQNLLVEVEYARIIFEELWSRYPHILCHNDLWGPNIILNKTIGEVYLIDWEMASPGIAPLELAHCSECFAELEHEAPVNVQDECRKSWARLYLQRCGQDASDELLDQWCRDMVKGALIINIAVPILFLWMISFKTISVEESHMRMEGVILGFTKFLDRKKRILQWKEV